jgi:hypothetical protein
VIAYVRWTLVVDGAKVDSAKATSGGLSAADVRAIEDERVAAVAPEVRLDMMRTEGINGEVIYPTIGLYVWNIKEPEVGQACCRIYNDWIFERLGGKPRIKFAGMVPTWNPTMAVDEVERLGKDPSIVGLLLPLVGTPEWNLPEWEPLWGAIAETGKPVVMHQGTGHDMVFYRGWGQPDGQRARDPVDGPEGGRAPVLQRDPRAPPGPARRHGGGQRRLAGVGDGHARRVLRGPGAPCEAEAGRDAQPLHPPSDPRDLPG